MLSAAARYRPGVYLRPDTCSAPRFPSLKNIRAGGGAGRRRHGDDGQKLELQEQAGRGRKHDSQVLILRERVADSVAARLSHVSANSFYLTRVCTGPHKSLFTARTHGLANARPPGCGGKGRVPALEVISRRRPAEASPLLKGSARLVSRVGTFNPTLKLQQTRKKPAETSRPLAVAHGTLLHSSLLKLTLACWLLKSFDLCFLSAGDL